MTDTEMKNSNEKFRFSGVKLCDKCGAVVLSDTLLNDHDNNCVVKNKEYEIDEHTLTEFSPKKYQLHCSLIESPGCQFQCETKEEMQHHIEIKHRGKFNYSVLYAISISGTWII